MHVSRVALRVSDVERSAAFYSLVTGMETRSLSLDAATLGAPAGGPVLLELRRAEQPGAAPRRATGLFHTAFLYRDRAGLGAAARKLLGGAAQMTGASDHGVSEAIYLDDPDGLGIELYADRPRSEWPEPAPGERAGIFTAPLDLAGVLAAAEEELPAAAQGLVVGHVHLKVAGVEEAVSFWTGEPGLDLMARYGPDAAFLGADGYHHHVGVNSWLSRGAAPEPSEGPGIDGVVLAGEERAATTTPEGVAVTAETR